MVNENDTRFISNRCIYPEKNTDCAILAASHSSVQLSLWNVDIEDKHVLLLMLVYCTCATITVPLMQ